MKLFGKMGDSLPVVTMTFREPTAAAISMLTDAVTDEALFTDKATTVTPAPKFNCVVAWLKCVYCPEIVTKRLLCPCWPEFGDTLVKIGVPPRMPNAFARDTLSVPVVTVIVCDPTAIVAINEVGLLTATDATVTPVPNATVVAP